MDDSQQKAVSAITSEHREEAKSIVHFSGWADDSSDALREGLEHAVAWSLAGRPTTPTDNIKTACPYGDRTPEKDAWYSGFALGKNHAGIDNPDD